MGKTGFKKTVDSKELDLNLKGNIEKILYLLFFIKKENNAQLADKIFPNTKTKETGCSWQTPYKYGINIKRSAEQLLKSKVQQEVAKIDAAVAAGAVAKQPQDREDPNWILQAYAQEQVGKQYKYHCWHYSDFIYDYFTEDVDILQTLDRIEIEEHKNIGHLFERGKNTKFLFIMIF